MFAGGFALLAQALVADEMTVAVAAAVSPPDEVTVTLLLHPLRLAVVLVCAVAPVPTLVCS
jgi:hypothetical protein